MPQDKRQEVDQCFVTGRFRLVSKQGQRPSGVAVMDKVHRLTGKVIEKVWGRFKREEYERAIIKEAFEAGQNKARQAINKKYHCEDKK